MSFIIHIVVQIWNKKNAADVEIEMLIYQSKANLDVKILFGNITRLIASEIRRMLDRVCLGTKIPHSILVHDLLAIEIKLHLCK